MMIDVVYVRPFDPTKTRLGNLFVPPGSDKEVFVLFGHHIPDGEPVTPEKLDKEVGGGFYFANWWKSKDRPNACNAEKAKEVRNFATWMEYIFPRVIDDNN